MHLIRILTLQFILCFSVYSASFDSDNSATVTKTEGQVQVFSNPSKELNGPPPHALYEGEYYSVSEAKPGDKVEKGNIIRTATKGKAELIFPNGDHVSIGAGSAFRVFWETEKTDVLEKGQSLFLLVYGKMRAVISKNGPRNNLKVRAGSVTMGIRGTDFFVSKKGIGNQVEVVTMRGSVEVMQASSMNTQDAKKIEVTSGYSANLDKSTNAVTLNKASREKLNDVSVSTDINADKPVNEQDDTKRKIIQLEEKAKEVTLKDIEQYQPEVFTKIKLQKNISLSELNQASIAAIKSNAPVEKVKPKPKLEDLKLDEDNYKRYFNSVK